MHIKYQNGTLPLHIKCSKFQSNLHYGYELVINLIAYSIPFLKIVEREISAKMPGSKAGFDVLVAFEEQEIVLELPCGIVGNGWKFTPMVTPTKVSLLKFHSTTIKRAGKCMLIILSRQK